MLPIKQLVENLRTGRLQIEDFFETIIGTKPYVEFPKYALKTLYMAYKIQRNAYVNSILKTEKERDIAEASVKTLSSLIQEIPNVKSVNIENIRNIENISSITSSIPLQMIVGKTRKMTITIEVNLP